MSSALAGGFLSNVPPGKSQKFLIIFIQLMLKVKFSEVHSVEEKHLSLNVSINSFKVQS